MKLKKLTQIYNWSIFLQINCLYLIVKCSPLDCKAIQPVHPKGDQSWIFIGRTNVEVGTSILQPPDAKSWLIWKDPTHLKRPWCWRRLKAGGEGDDKGWDGWMASPTQWTWVWVTSGRWWWTRRPGVLRFMRLQRVGHDWMTELNWMYKARFVNHAQWISWFLVA